MSLRLCCLSSIHHRINKVIHEITTRDETLSSSPHEGYERDTNAIVRRARDGDARPPATSKASNCIAASGGAVACMRQLL